MSAGKSTTIYGMTCLLEGSYAAGGSPTTSDGIQLAELPAATPAWANDGARAAPPGTLGYQQRVAASGRIASASFKVEPRGPGIAYSASVTPNIHKLLRAAGFDAVGSFTGGSEKYTYTLTPGPTGYGSLVANLYPRGELWPVTGLYSDFLIGCEGPGLPIAEFPWQALLGTISDSAVPAITYPQSAVNPPKSANIQFALGSFTTQAIVRKWQFKLGREITPRLNQNGNVGHAGFSIGRRTPQLEVTYETPALVGNPYTAAGGVDPYLLYESGLPFSTFLQIGAGQYDRYKFTFSTAQVMKEPTLDSDGPTALTTLTLQCNPSALGSNDEVSLVFD